MTSELCNEPILDALRPALLELAVPERADGMAAYMKSAIPFLGVPSPAVRKLVRTLAKKHTFKDAVHLHATITELWNSAEFREEKYAAIMLTDSRLGRGELRLLPFYAVVVETGQWWDFVDAVAPRL